MWNENKALTIAQAVTNWLERWKNYPNTKANERALGLIICGLALGKEQMFFKALQCLENTKSSALEYSAQKIIEACYRDAPAVKLEIKTETSIDNIQKVELSKIFTEEKARLDKELEHCPAAGEYCSKCGWEKHCKYKNKEVQNA